MKHNTILYTRVIAGGIALLLLGGASIQVSAASVKPETAASAEIISAKANSASPLTDTVYAVSGQDSTLQANLREIVLTASVLNERRSPLRLKSVNREQIERRAIGSTYPELVRDIPGIYATSESGSYGDARINIRGFKQENISVMLNGIPVSGLVTGNMFWNNWLGLADATHTIQVQKGIGGSMLSDNSVGGTINIITTTPQTKASASAGIFYTSYGQGKSFLSMNSGKLKGGWAISAMASYAFGSGYVQQTDVNSWAYMVNISKRINSRHSLLLTALGSPERHEQRSARLSASEVDVYGLSYSKNWGYRNMPVSEGSSETKRVPFNLSENFYHKPYITLHHFYNPGNGFELSNTAYVSVGNGGGRWSESNSKRLIDFQKDGYIDWDTAIAVNRRTDGSSYNILTDYLAGHTQTGIKSNATYKAQNGITYTAGLHYQFYSTWEKEVITDLLGGDYWFEDYEGKSLAGLAGRNTKKVVGDHIRTDNGKIISHLTAYAMANYSSEEWEMRLGASAMGSTNQRWDRYNYINDYHSDVATAAGYSIKGGALHKISRNSSVYFNAAVYSRLPYSDVFFSGGNNEITKGVKNEKNILSEVGYRFIFDRGSFEATGYAAYWKNKTIMSDPYKQQFDNVAHRYMVQGLDALHIGIEADAEFTPYHWLKLRAYGSVGSWKWKNDVSAIIYDNYSGIEMGRINVYSHGLAVGDAPQTQAGLSADIKVWRHLRLNAEWRWNSRLYADFDPVSRQNSSDRNNSLRLPDYNIANAGVTWSERFGKIEATFFGNVNNILNSKYIERGKDGYDHTMNSFRGFWGFGINASAGVRLAIF